MKIEQKFEFCTGNFDTVENKMVCVQSDKYHTVDLCLEDGSLFPIARVKLYNTDLWVDSKDTYEDAVKLGEEISRRWNECGDKK